MRDVVTNALTLSPQNFSVEVAWALGIIYGAMWLVTMTSVIQQSFGVASKIAWVIIVTAVPIVGMVFYSARCLLSADFGFLKQLGFAKAHSREIPSRRREISA